MKISEIITSLILLLLIVACDNNSLNTIRSFGDIELNKSSFHIGDTVLISGSSLNKKSSIFLIGDQVNFIIDPSNDDRVILNTDALIAFVNYGFQGSFDLFVVSDSDTSNSLKIELLNYPSLSTVEVQGGTFTMGYEWGLPDETSERDVEISHSLEVMQFELSQSEYNLLMNPEFSFWDPNLPVTIDNWEKAVEYCFELNAKMNLEDAIIKNNDSYTMDPSKNGWRLPSEAEWEYICKGSSNMQVPPNDDLSSVAWFIENSSNKYFTRGLKQASQIGLFDILGNLSEWCFDLYDENYYSMGENIDPLGPTEGSYRVRRGGSFQTPRSRCRSSFRMSTELDSNTVGLRLVRTIQ